MTTAINPQAQMLNETIGKTHPAILELLSQKGKGIFFPKSSILAQGAEAKGKEINATIGIALEDDGTPMRLKTIHDQVPLDPGDVYPYAPSFGKKELREKWQQMLREKNPTLGEKPISLPVVTNALTHGLSLMGYMFLDEGEEIVLPSLFWGNYKLVFIHGHKAKLNPFTLFEGDHFNMTSFREKLNEGPIGKKVVLMNFPNNPTGYTATNEEIREIISIFKEAAEAGNQLVVMMDDAYFGLVFREGIYKESLFAELADLHPNLLAVKIDGITKEDYAWGFRVGFITYGVKGGTPELYAALEDKTAGALRGNISNSPHLSQSLALQSFNSPQYPAEKKAKLEILEKRYNLVCRLLDEKPQYKEHFTALPCNSGYFMCLKLEKHNSETLRKHLLEHYSTGVIALEGMLRIAFSSTPTQKLEKLMENIFQACNDLDKQ
jgi:aspartate/methionine/tyrosine aminotransferase